MSSQAQQGPTPARAADASSSSGGGVVPSPDALQQAFDHGIWYALSLWPALHVACQNGWGGPDSADKKDWFAGAVSELFAARPDTDSEELEAFLLQVMLDEFECNVEDDSEVEVARTVMRLQQSLAGAGPFAVEGAQDRLAVFREVERRWQNRGQMKVDVQVVNGEDGDDDDEWEGFDDDDADDDVDMDAAQEMVPSLVPALPKREKAEPEVDDEGFTKVAGKKRR